MARRPNLYKEVLQTASEQIQTLTGRTFNVFEISRPADMDYAIYLAKITSKLSPMVGNIIEFRIVSDLNKLGIWPDGKWVRQDPGFPDTIFQGCIHPVPGIEIKTWFPLATEITARFKDSITHFTHDQINIAMVAWIPERVIYGKPQIISTWVDSALSVALARDKHYHNPPDYLVFEPEDTSNRTQNLRQTNTNGYKFQGSSQQMSEAQRIVSKWGADANIFSPSPEYQRKVKSLLGKFSYRLDTNFAKMDRIEHPTLERFKQEVLGKDICGHTISDWADILRNAQSPQNRQEIQRLLGL